MHKAGLFTSGGQGDLGSGGVVCFLPTVDAPVLPDIVEKLLRAARQGVKLLEDAHQRPNGHPTGMAPMALDLLLRTLAVEAERLVAEAELVPASRTLLTDYIQAFRTHQRTAVRLESHLLDLAQGWRCSHCTSQVPAGGVLDLPERPRLELRCKGCGCLTAVDASGQTRFEAVFGHLFAPGWEVTKNGFERRRGGA